MNLKQRALEALSLANKPRTLTVRFRKNGTPYAVWRPKLPPGAVNLEWQGDQVRVTFNRRVELAGHSPIRTYQGLVLLAGFWIPKQYRHLYR